MTSVRLNDEMEERLNYYASLYKIPKSRLIKESLEYYFEFLSKNEPKKSPYELGKGLFGKYSSGKKDLSVTYKQRIKDKINDKNSH